MAAAMPIRPISPTPLTADGGEPVGFADEDHVHVGNVGVDGHQVVGEGGVGDAPVPGSVTASSSRAVTRSRSSSAIAPFRSARRFLVPRNPLRSSDLMRTYLASEPNGSNPAGDTGGRDEGAMLPAAP